MGKSTYLNAFQFTRDCKNELAIGLSRLLTAIPLDYEIFLFASFLSEFAMGNAKFFFISSILFCCTSHRIDFAAAQVVRHFRVIVVRRGRLLERGELLCLRIVHRVVVLWCCEGWERR